MDSTIGAGLASATNTAPAASVSTPSAPAEKPSSLSDHFKAAGVTDAGDAASPTPATALDPTAQPVPATAAPVDPNATAEPTPGEPPPERWPAILENARTKEREAVLSEVRQQYGGDVQFANAWRTDPIGSLQRAVEEMRGDPVLGPQLASLAGKQLAASRKSAQPQQPQNDPEPQADYQLADGTPFYSEPQQRKWDAWKERQLTARLEQRFRPALQLAQHMQQLSEADAQVSQTLDAYAPMVEELQSMPGFAEHRAEILKRQHALFEQAYRSGQRVNHVALLARAYREIVPAKQQQQQQQTLTATALAKAAGRDPNPAAVAASPPPPPKSLREAFQQVGLVGS